MKIEILSNFVLGKNHLGKAVFAARVFNINDVVTKFEGPIVTSAELPKKLEGDRDRYVQIGIKSFLGPSGKVDDFINHSCDPNAGLRFTDTDIILIAIKKINIGDEITWDYSTTLFDNSWKMLCHCNKNNCRKIIGDFILLDSKIQKKYYDLNVIPQYIKNYMESSDYLVYTKGINSLKRYAEKKVQN